MDLRFDFIAPINTDSVLQLKNHIECQEGPIEHLQLNINSLGGELTPAVMAYNFLKNRPFPITTHNLGEVTSAAVLIYLAGKNRTSEKYSKFIMHPIQCTLNGSLSYNQLQERLRSIVTDIENYAEIVNQETGFLHNKYDIKECLMGSNITLNTRSALECGMITHMI